jgi:hypothetical protein
MPQSIRCPDIPVPVSQRESSHILLYPGANIHNSDIYFLFILKIRLDEALLYK